jgi:hypothetical protein
MEISGLFKVACANIGSFYPTMSLEITKLLLQFADNDSVDNCLKTALSKKMENNISIFLPRAKRERLASISQSTSFTKLRRDTQQKAADRIKNFSTEISIELAFLPKDKDDIRSTLQTELGEYSAELTCKDQQDCIDTMKSMNPAAVVFPVEQAIERLLERAEDNAALEKLLPFATPYACAQIVSLFPEHGSEEATKACATKALRAEVSRSVRSVKDEKDFKLMKLLAPFVSPLEIVRVLELASFSESNAKRAKALLADLPSDLADDALRIAVRGSKGEREKNVRDLLPKTSKAAIDEAYLFAKRIKFYDEQLEKAASGMAKAQGREIERGRGAK